MFVKKVGFLRLGGTEHDLDFVWFEPGTEPVQFECVEFRARSVSSRFQVSKCECALIVFMNGGAEVDELVVG